MELDDRGFSAGGPFAGHHRRTRRIVMATFGNPPKKRERQKLMLAPLNARPSRRPVSDVGYFNRRSADQVMLDGDGRPVRAGPLDDQGHATTLDDRGLVDLHFQALEENDMPRRIVDPPPPSAPDLGPEEEEEEEEEDEAGEEEQETAADTQPPPPEPETIAPPPKPRNRRGKRPGAGLGPPMRSPEGLAGPTGDSPRMPGPSGGNHWPTDASMVWQKIVEEAYRMGSSPHEIYITVERFGIGGYAAEPVQLGQIEGGAVSGSESISPAQALTDYVVQVCHAQAPGPARYRFNFCWKRGGKVKVGELRLGHPQELANQRMMAAQRAATSPPPGFGRTPTLPAFQPPPPGFGAMPPPGYYPPPYMPPPQQYFSQPAFDMGPVEAMRRELAQTLGALNESRAREAEARGLPPPPPVVAAPTISPEADDARTARVVVGVLQSMGIRPVGSAAPAQVGFGAAISDAKEKISGLRELVGIFREVEKLKEGMGFGGLEETVEMPAPIVEDPSRPAFGVKPIPFAKWQGKDVLWAERKDDEAILSEWLPKMAAANPELAMSLLERALRVFDQGAFGVLLRKFAEQGGPAATAASVMADRVANGASVGRPDFPAP
jgi:hypothetical protein